MDMWWHWEKIQTAEHCLFYCSIFQLDSVAVPKNEDKNHKNRRAYSYTPSSRCCATQTIRVTPYRLAIEMVIANTSKDETERAGYDC
jgi:hypothetical protein